MDALLRTVDARVSVIDTQLALRDALDVLDRTGTNSPESYKVFTQLFDTCRKGGPDLVVALLTDTDVMGSMLQNIVPRLQDIQDSEALQDCLSFLGLLVAEAPVKVMNDDGEDDDGKRRRVDGLETKCAEKILQLSKGGSEIVALITKQDADMYLLYAELRLIQSLHKRFPRIIASAVLEAPEVVAALVDLLKTCPAAFVRNECLALVHNMVSAAKEQGSRRATTASAATEEMQIFPMLAFQGVIEALFGIVLEDPVVSAGDVPVVALDTNLQLLRHEKTRSFWRTGGRESAQWTLEVFRHALYPNHRQRRGSEAPDQDLFPERRENDEDLKGIANVATFKTVWPTLKLSMEILHTYWGPSAHLTNRSKTQNQEKVYCIDLGIIEIIIDQIDNYHLSDECRRELLHVILTLLQSCGKSTVEKLTSSTASAAATPGIWKIASLMVQSPPPSISFRSSVSSFIEKATDLPGQLVSIMIQNSLCATFSATVAGMSTPAPDDAMSTTVVTPGSWVISHLQGIAVGSDTKGMKDTLPQVAMHVNAWFSLQLLMNCVKGKNVEAQKMLSSSAVIPSSSGGYQSLLTFLDKILLSLADRLEAPFDDTDGEGSDSDASDNNTTALWSKDPSTVPTTVIAILQTLLVFRVDADVDDAISTEPVYLRLLQSLMRYRGPGKVDINGLASLLLGTCLKPSCANNDLATSIIEADIGVIQAYRAGAILLDSAPRPAVHHDSIAKRPTWYPSFFIQIARRAHQDAQRCLVQQTLHIRDPGHHQRDDDVAKLRSMLEVQQREVARSKQEASDTLQVLAGMSEQLSELRDTDTASLVERIEGLQTAKDALTEEVEALKRDNENLAKYLIAEREAASRLIAESSYQLKALAGCYRDENLRVQKLIAQQQQQQQYGEGSPYNGGPTENVPPATQDLVDLVSALKRVCPSVLDIIAAPIDQPISNRLPPKLQEREGSVEPFADDNPSS